MHSTCNATEMQSESGQTSHPKQRVERWVSPPLQRGLECYLLKTRPCCKRGSTAVAVASGRKEKNTHCGWLLLPARLAESLHSPRSMILRHYPEYLLKAYFRGFGKEWTVKMAGTLAKRVSSKASYSPYLTGRRKKAPKTQGSGLVPSRPSVWFKELPSVVSGPLDGTTMAKRPTSLSRHASAAGFPLSPAKGLPKSHKAHSPGDGVNAESSLTDPEDIAQLLADVACFAERLEKLKDVVLQEDGVESRRPVAHEYLGEALRILRQIISKYPLLNTLETLTAAGTLISKVKGFHYESNNEAEKREFEKAVEMIAVSFSSTVSEFLMGEVDCSTILSMPPSDANQSMENLYGGIPGQGAEILSDRSEDFSSIRLSAEEVDVLLQKCEGGVAFALKYAKNISKYMKDLIYYLEKRTALEMEFAKGLQKMANTCKQTITQEPHMPFLSIYSLALEQDSEYAASSLHAAVTLRMETFLQPLQTRRLEHEKRRKEIKEQWGRAQRKLQEAENNLRKAKQVYMQRSEESEKAKNVAAKAEEEQMGSVVGGGGGGGTGAVPNKALEKKRRLEEEARNKAEEAMATYRTCIADANTQRQELEDTKVTSLRQIHEVVKQSDQVIKSATISFYQTMHMQTAPLPVYFQTLCESSKLYDPGQQYASHVKRLQREDEPDTQYDFEPYVSHNWSPIGRTRKGSCSASESAQGSGTDVGGKDGERRGGRGHQVHKSWPTVIAETKDHPESNTSSSGEFPAKFPAMPSNGSFSPSEESDGNSPSFEQSIQEMSPGVISAATGPFRHVGLSKAAQTHRLRKLRTPSKCRECNSYVYFQGAECEECYLACHKKCLETLAIQCGHKKLRGKLQLFGQDFLQASGSSSDGIPFIVQKCILEIEKRATRTKGIYRVNGVKTRVEKLCQAFENGKELVELSQASPHDISNVLKLYLRQLPEPILPFRMYNALMGLAKESLQGGKSAAEMADKGPETDPAVLALVTKLRELLSKELPAENRATLRFLVQHLRRIVAAEGENKMTPGNLGIVFGPTLMRPRPTEATISLSSLVDYPHQARIIEAFIIFYPDIFETPQTLVVGLEEEEEEDEEVTTNQDDETAYLVPTPDPDEAALHEESSARFIDSDSDEDDGAEGVLPARGARRSKSSADEETPSADEEGARSHSEPEDVSAPQGKDVEDDAVFGRDETLG
ncbi:rho GTPase-activating protein 45 isoform X1 [Anolis carolinensis]|uniref:rho GTPase-activating protein 45 isoform X1 n=1 Tax=Anolis carolinensis TaxID=28377 RepID=UPI002F2B3FC6